MLCVLCVLCVLPMPSPAQDGAAPTRLAPVVVTATREAEDALLVPAAIDAIGAHDLRRAQPQINLSETLQRVPGVVARDRNNYAQDLQISIRGYGARATFGVRGVRLYTDGIPATMPDGQGQVSHFGLESAERIEILRGPFSALYGNSSGGVISLFTADAPAVPTAGFGQVVGADGLRRTSLSLHAPFGTRDDGSALVDLAQVDSDGYRDHSAARRRNGQALFRGRLGDGGSYTLLLNHLDLVADDPQGLNAAQLAGDRRAASAPALAFDTRKTVRQSQVGARFEQDMSANHQVALTAYTGGRETTQMLSVPAAAQASPLSGGGAIDLDRDYRGADLRWRWSTALLQRPFSLAAGVEYQLADERRLGFENFIGPRLGVVGAVRRDERNRVTGRDAYAQADWAPAERWRLNAGVRRSEVRFVSDDRFVTAANPDDSGELEYARTSPVVGVLYRATPQLSLYANAGAGFETPTFAELAYRNDGASGLNDALRPARSINHEAGLRLRRDGVDAAFALFQSRTRDELVVVSNQGGRSVFGNAGLSRRRGAEVSLATPFAGHWHFATAYTYLDARYRRDVAGCAAPPCAPGALLIAAGRQLPGVSRHLAWAEVRRRFGDRTELALEGRHTGRIFVNDANSESAPAGTSFDLSAERHFDWGALEGRMFARINNVLDRDIIGSVIVNDANGRYYEPAPGRYWLAGLSLGWAVR